MPPQMRKEKASLFSEMELPETIPESDEETAHCVRLWRAVLDQAINDALIPDWSDEDSLMARGRAATWLNGRSQDLWDVCHLAMLEPAWAKEQIRKFIQSANNLLQQDTPVPAN